MSMEPWKGYPEEMRVLTEFDRRMTRRRNLRNWVADSAEADLPDWGDSEWVLFWELGTSQPDLEPEQLVLVVRSSFTGAGGTGN